MRNSIFIDTDIFLDTILGREPHSQFSNRLLSLCEFNKIKGHTSSLVLANIYYVINKIASHQKAIDAIRKIRAIVTVLSFTDKEIGESINAEFRDFEDGVQYFIALNSKIEYIVTRNVRDFKKGSLNILTPAEYLKTLKIKNA